MSSFQERNSTFSEGAAFKSLIRIVSFDDAVIIWLVPAK